MYSMTSAPGANLYKTKAYGPECKELAIKKERSLEHWLKGKQLKSEDDLKLELSAFFESKKLSFYDYGIRSLARRWQRVIDHHGSYFQ
ncbi:hypothetical protein Y032_0293g1624 [Ancylostoma ceylanicum]|nr:hypothetical protein Y032_0293g1624 [Ancylostoma ceylanicum]